MAFSFGFSGDDIDIDDTEVGNDVQDIQGSSTAVNSLPELVKACKHDIEDWVSREPAD